MKVGAEHAAARKVRKHYEQPSPIPAVTSDGGTETALSKVRGLAKEKVRGALCQETDEAYWEYWCGALSEFSSYLQTLSTLSYAANVNDGRRPDVEDVRASFLELCIKGAAKLCGPDSAVWIRKAFADSRAAAQIIGRFPSRQVLEGNEDDQANVSNYNEALRQLDALLVSVAEGASVDVTEGLRACVVVAPAVVAEDLHALAVSAAKRRGVATDFDLRWIEAAWPVPDRDLLEYLTERAPNLVTDQLRAVCDGFDRFDEMLATVAGGGTVGAECLPAEGDDDEDIRRWANRLATDLATHQD